MNTDAVPVDPTGRRSQLQPVRLKLDGGVEADGFRLYAVIPQAFDREEVEVLYPELPGLLSEDLRGPSWIGKLRDSINEKKGLVADADIARVLEGVGEVTAVTAVVGFAMTLLDENVLLQSIPSPGPVLVGPAKAKRKVSVC